MYSDLFSRVYDAFGWNYYPEIFAQQLVHWMEKYQIRVKTMLDLGCGTGILCSILSERGIHTVGMDLSAGMISMAKEKYPALNFEQGDMITYCPAKKFDLVTSTCDAINHILDPDDLKKVLKNIFTYLEPGGCLLFDLLKEEETVPCDPVDLGEIDGCRLTFQILRTASGAVTLQIDVSEQGRHVHTEQIREQIYSPGQILSLLAEAGFESCVCSDRLLGEESEQASTWFVTARKPGKK